MKEGVKLNLAPCAESRGGSSQFKFDMAGA